MMLNAALVGFGWWGRTIAGTMAASDRLRIAAVVDPNPAAIAQAAAIGLPCRSGLDAALADPEIQAVILCTPHTLHAAQIAAAAAAGRHVFCEKPLCLTRADAESAIAACEAAGIVLGIGHERRFEPPMQMLTAMALSGELGALLQIEANFSQDKFLSLPPDNWRLSGSEAPAGPMTATGIHLLDLSVSLLGRASRATARVRQLGSPLVNGDTLGALVEFESGANALISAILATPFDGRFAVYGSQGWAELRDKAHPETPEGWTLTVSRRGHARAVTEYPPASSVRRNLDSFAEAALGGAAYPVPTSQMLATVSALEAIVRSAASGQIEPVA